MKYKVVAIDNETRNFVVNYITKNWGSSKVISKGKIHHTEDLSGFVALEDGEVKGIITYSIDNNECEIVTLASLCENCGIGNTLIEEVVNIAKKNKCKRVWLVTTNDNIHAIRYYQKRCFNLVALHRNAVNESRKIKPQIPLIGFDGIPVLHEIEFEKVL